MNTDPGFGVPWGGKTFWQTKERIMRTRLIVLIALASLLAAAPASADFFALEADVQGTYLRLNNIAVPETSEVGTIAGMGAGFRGRLQILFLNALVDYQHLFTNGAGVDMLHAGLGLGYRLDSLPVISLYVQGSIGVLMLAADEGAFLDYDDSPALDPEMGGQVRVGGGLEFTFASDYLALGVGADVGGHYLTGEFGYDFSVNVHFGLRI